jgi:hypothetical protein
MSADALYEKWLGWLQTVQDETMTLWLYRDYWRGLAEMTKAADLPPSTFFDALGVWYAAAQTTGVRRQLDRDRRSVSIWRLLTEMAQRPDVMTRQRHVAIWRIEDEREGAKEAMAQLANENYDKFAGAGNDIIAPPRTLEDRTWLEDIAERIVEHVNKRVAHTDEENLAKVPSYDELNVAIDETGELLRKYVSLFEATILAEIAPVHQADWRAPFRQAWLPDDA